VRHINRKIRKELMTLIGGRNAPQSSQRRCLYLRGSGTEEGAPNDNACCYPYGNECNQEEMISTRGDWNLPFLTRVFGFHFHLVGAAGLHGLDFIAHGD
jgi:hypothetical protein